MRDEGKGLVALVRLFHGVVGELLLEQVDGLAVVGFAEIDRVAVDLRPELIFFTVFGQN
jgi:hypothetical protein